MTQKSFNIYDSGDEADEAQEVIRQIIIPGCYPAIKPEPVDCTLRHISTLVLVRLRTNTSGIVKTISSGTLAVSELFVYKKNLYVAGSTAATGLELWKYDGISGSLVADINPGAGSGLSSTRYLPATTNPYLQSLTTTCILEQMMAYMEWNYGL